MRFYQTHFSAVAMAALLTACPVRAEMLPPGAFAGAPAGVLTVRMEVQGQARNNHQNGVEWDALQVSRSLDLKLLMLDPGTSGTPGVSIGGRQADHGDAKSMMPPQVADIAAAVEACKGDKACQMKTMMALMPKVQAIESAAEVTGGVIDGGHYQNWIADSRTVGCATGEMSAVDTGDGMAISPPSPAAYYKFRRDGKTVLPDGNDASVEAACRAEITFDLQQKTASIRLPARGLSVPVSLSGQAFTREKSVPFLEGVDKIEILDRPAAEVDGWSGDATMVTGSVSHNSGSVAVPVTVKISWRFETAS